MPMILKQRNRHARERMDDPDCDRQLLFNTYRQFSTINSLLSRWKTIYNREIVTACEDPLITYRLLDIGFGGGDLPLKISRWAQEDQIKLEITAIDSDQRAFEYIQQKPRKLPPNIHFRAASSGELVQAGEQFDFVISNHLLHHLSNSELQRILEEAVSLSSKKVLFNDIERSDLGYLLFNLLSRPLFRGSFITEDGLTSIRRSYTFSELKAQIPNSWKVKRIFPFRLLLSYEHK
jgi:2-polyprenyl-3-methyl-5-hydroxy-6-metoxy-1,4-benzoquinol methylase